MKTIDTLEKEYTASIYALSKLIDAGAPLPKLNAERANRARTLAEIRKASKDFDRGYT